MSLDYKILGQELVSHTTVEEPTDTTSYYVSYEGVPTPTFLARGYANTNYYSNDGINWTEASSLYPYYHVEYFDGRFISLNGNDGEPGSYSADGLSWTYFSTPFSGVGRISYGDGKYVALQFYSSVAGYSTDGVTWTLTSVPTSNFWIGVTYGDGKFVAVHNDPSNKAIYSFDGINWYEATLPLTQSFRSIAFSAELQKFVIIPNVGNQALYSSDGLSWYITTLPGDPNNTFYGPITYGDDKFVVVGSFGIASYSYDGINWFSANNSVPLGIIEGIVYGDGKFVACGVNQNSLAATAVSTDGINWTGPHDANSLYGFNSIAYGITDVLTETLNIIGGQGTTQTEEFLPVTIYTVPAGKQTTVTSVYVANHNNTETTYDFAVVPSGEELSLKHHLRWDMPIAASDFEVINTKITMSAGDKLVIFPSTVDTVSVTAFGVEK